MKLIVNADDFGITSACNDTIIRLYQEGKVTSCSLMTNMPAAEEAAALWKENPGLSVGLHLCVTAGRPLTQVPGLVREDGTFDKSLWEQERPVDLKQLQQELQAQLDRFIQLTGRKPEHLDSHHGIERIPGAARILADMARENDLPLRRFLYGTTPQDLPFEVPALILGLETGEDGEPVPGFTDRLTGAGVLELALHPGKADEDLARLSGLTTGREREAAALRSDGFARVLADPEVELVSWRDVKRA